jgi:hypothetical protein
MKKLLYMLAIIILTTSCEEWLDIKPKGKIIPEKAEDYQLLMDQTIAKGSSVGWVKTYGNDLYITDDVTTTDNAFSNYFGEKGRNAYTWADHIYLETEEDPDWQNMYNQIYVANLVIDEVRDATGGTDLKNQLYAEAKVQRAYSYLVLVNLYAKHYKSGTAASDLGVPLLTKPAIEGSLTRASVKQVYDLILSDLNEVVGFLPDLPIRNHRTSKASAYALLSRVHLFMGDFTSSLENANKSITLYNFMYNYNTLPSNAWYANLLDIPKSYLNKELLLNKEPANSYSVIYPSVSLTNAYNQTNDIRYIRLYDVEFFEPFTSKIYFQEYLTGRNYGLSVSEMILTQAECYARASNITEAMAKVNYIRERRLKAGTYVPLTATTQSEALAIVKNERRVELAFKGVRWFDLKRYNAYDNANITLTHIVNGKTYTLAPNDNHWVLPIGRKYIQKNPEIEQNPR